MKRDTGDRRKLIKKRDLPKYELLGWRQTANRNPFLTERDKQKYITVVRCKTATANPQMQQAEEEFLRLERKIHPSAFYKTIFALSVVICLVLTVVYCSFSVGFSSNAVTDFLAKIAEHSDLFHFLSLPVKQACVIDAVICLTVLTFLCILRFVRKKRAKKKEEILLKNCEAELLRMKCHYRDQKIDQVRNKMKDISAIRLP